jgi:hypothetical protein
MKFNLLHDERVLSLRPPAAAAAVCLYMALLTLLFTSRSTPFSEAIRSFDAGEETSRSVDDGNQEQDHDEKSDE